MAWVAVAVVGSTIIGGMIGANSANNAAASASNSANQANATQQNEFNTQQANIAPWLAAGKGALSDLQNQMPDLKRPFTAADFHADPGYNFDLQQGEQAMQRSAAAKGMLNSTGTLQGLNNYAQGMASNEYQNAYNRFTANQQQRYNMLAGVAGTGQVASGQLAQVGMNTANNISGNTMAAGNMSAAANIANGNNMSSALSNGVNGYMNWNMMNKFSGNGGVGTGGNWNNLIGAQGSTGMNTSGASNPELWTMGG